MDLDPAIDEAAAENAGSKGDSLKKHADKREFTKEQEQEKQRSYVQRVQKRFARNPKSRIYFYEYLTHDLCRNRHRIIEPSMLATSCPLDNGRHDTPEVVALANTSSLGSLDNLPLELIHQILYRGMAISTLTTCRGVSRRFRLIIDNLPQYKVIITHAPTALRATLSLGSHHFTSLPVLYEALCLNECSGCGNFGAYLYLLECKRVCFNCFTTKEEYLPIEWSYSQSLYLIKPSDILACGASTVRSIPGQYGRYSRIHQNTRFPFVGMSEAAIVGGIIRGSMDRTSEAASQKEDERWEKYDAEVLRWEATPLEKRKRRHPVPPPFADYVDVHAVNPHRSMCIVGFPWLDRSRGILEWGVACQGCKVSRWRFISLAGQELKKALEEEGVLYSEEGFIGHFAGCTVARDLCRSFKNERRPTHRASRSGICNTIGHLSARRSRMVCVGGKCPVPPPSRSDP